MPSLFFAEQICVSFIDVLQARVIETLKLEILKNTNHQWTGQRLFYKTGVDGGQTTEIGTSASSSLLYLKAILEIARKN
jgi:hypothetical protein